MYNREHDFLFYFGLNSHYAIVDNEILLQTIMSSHKLEIPSAKYSFHLSLSTINII